jgi:hypothetical protein
VIDDYVEEAQEELHSFGMDVEDVPIYSLDDALPLLEQGFIPGGSSDIRSYAEGGYNTLTHSIIYSPPELRRTLDVGSDDSEHTIDDIKNWDGSDDGQLLNLLEHELIHAYHWQEFVPDLPQRIEETWKQVNTGFNTLLDYVEEYLPQFTRGTLENRVESGVDELRQTGVLDTDKFVHISAYTYMEPESVEDIFKNAAEKEKEEDRPSALSFANDVNEKLAEEIEEERESIKQFTEDLRHEEQLYQRFVPISEAFASVWDMFRRGALVGPYQPDELETIREREGIETEQYARDILHQLYTVPGGIMDRFQAALDLQEPYFTAASQDTLPEKMVSTSNS